MKSFLSLSPQSSLKSPARPSLRSFRKPRAALFTKLAAILPLAVSAALSVPSTGQAFSGSHKSAVETPQEGGASTASQRVPSSGAGSASGSATGSISIPGSSSVPGSSSAKDLDSVWISRPDGGQSCSPKSGQALDAVAQELKSAGIAVIESRKGNDGKMRAQMCGVATGGFNSYKISKGDLGKAQALGFQKL